MSVWPFFLLPSHSVLFCIQDIITSNNTGSNITTYHDIYLPPSTYYLLLLLLHTIYYILLRTHDIYLLPTTYYLLPLILPTIYYLLHTTLTRMPCRAYSPERCAGHIYSHVLQIIFSRTPCRSGRYPPWIPHVVQNILSRKPCRSGLPRTLCSFSSVDIIFLLE